MNDQTLCLVEKKIIIRKTMTFAVSLKMHMYFDLSSTNRKTGCKTAAMSLLG